MNLTIGNKLFASFASMLILIVGLLAVHLVSGRESNRRLLEVMQVQNRKLEIGAQVELAVTEMQGAQRGLMLSHAMHDPDAAEPYQKLYASSGNKIDDLLKQLQPLLTAPKEIAAADQIRGNRAVWAPRFQALVDLCREGRIPAAYELRNQNKVISAQMHAAATSLVNQQKSELEQARLASERAVAMASWLSAFILCFSLLLGAVVLAVVRGITGTLRQVVADLDASADQVASASREVASASQTAAQGSTQLAASIEETSASSTEIKSMAERNSAHSRAAQDVMSQTSVVVDQSNRYLENMQTSMQQINSSCEKVGKIIEVIDQIAFQTNILALNAAVESARAGEAGLGFAVVADEVRNLAHRSAGAARETAGLIEESMARSKEGCVILDQVAGSIRKVTGGSREISSLVNHVSTGSVEQTQGPRQIAGAIAQMEQVTQAAAATAEETAAIGEQMSAQAESLNSIVQRLHAMLG